MVWRAAAAIEGRGSEKGFNAFKLTISVCATIGSKVKDVIKMYNTAADNRTSGSGQGTGDRQQINE